LLFHYGFINLYEFLQLWWWWWGAGGGANERGVLIGNKFGKPKLFPELFVQF
jgi:hypothetical protein